MKQSLGTRPALRASGSFPEMGFRGQGCALRRVCACLGVSPGLCAEAGAGPRTPAVVRTQPARMFSPPASESPPLLGAEKTTPRVAQACGWPSPGLRARGSAASPGPSWARSPARPGQKPSPTGPATWGETHVTAGPDIKPTWTRGQEEVAQSLRLSHGSDTGKRGPGASLLGQNQSSTTFLQREFAQVTKTSEPQFSRL